LGFPATLPEKICERIRTETGIQRNAVLLNGSHTHHGPIPDVRGPDPLDDKSRALLREYLDGLERKTAGIVKEALAGMRPARLSWGAGVAGFVINRRQPTARGTALGVNPRGYADRTVPVLRVETPQGKIMCLFGAAWHGVTVEPELKINGDYAGYCAGVCGGEDPGCPGDVHDRLRRRRETPSPGLIGTGAGAWPLSGR
jgi:hypothetical protein